MTQSRRGIRQLSRPLDYREPDSLAALEEAFGAHPRAAAIVGVTFVEDALRWAIGAYLRPDLTPEEDEALFDREGAPLSTFHSKVIMGYSLGLFGPVTRDDLMCLKRIRNAFAHSPRSITFDTPEIVKECCRLKYLERKIMRVASQSINNSRDKFKAVVRLFILDLFFVGSK